MIIDCLIHDPVDAGLAAHLREQCIVGEGRR
jgi:hypothetical protein